MKSLRQYLNKDLLITITIFSCLFIFPTLQAQAQTTPTTTRVLVGSIPIPFAVCTNTTTNETTVSDASGLLTLPQRNLNDTLEVRSLGFETLKILPNDDITSETRLNENPVGIDAVIITSNISPVQVQREGLKGLEQLQVTSVVSSRPPGKSTDLLMNTGQVMVQQSQQGGGSPIIRGFEANRILLVVDGVRMNNAIYRSGHLQNAITVDPNSLEQVQVIMGPSSVKYGSDALGGVIHFQTHRPKFRRRDTEKMWGGHASLQTMTNNSSNVIHTRVDGGAEKWATLLSLTASDFGDLRMGEKRMHGDADWGLMNKYVARYMGAQDTVLINNDPNVQIGTGYNQLDLMHKLRVAIPGGALQTNIQYSTSSPISRYDRINDINENTSQPVWAEWYYGPQNRLLTSLSWEQFLGIPGSLHTTVAYQNIQESRHKRVLYGSNLTNQYEDVDVMSFNSVWRSSPNKESFWDFEMGVDGQWNGVASTSSSTSDSILVETRYANDGSTMLNFGAVVSAKRTKGDKVLHAGLRYNRSILDANFDLDNTPFNQLGFENVHMNNGALTGSLGFEMPIESKIRSTTSLSSGFRNPNIDDVTKIREKDGILLIPNDNISPEYIYSFDQSITISPFNDQQLLSITGAGFFSLWADAIAPITTTYEGDSLYPYEGESVLVNMNSNIDNAFVYGARCELRSQFTDALSFNGTVNYTVGQTITDKAPLSHIPPLFGRIGLKYSSNNFSLSTYSLFNGEKHESLYGPGTTDNLNEALPDGTPAWWTLNIDASIDLNDNLYVHGGVQNILDFHYKQFASGLSAPGRGFFLAINANF